MLPKRNFYGKGLLLAGMIMCLTFSLYAQVQELRTLSDTSYFRTGEDDWNLLESVLRGNHASAYYLLQRGADPNARAEGGMTALMFASEKGDTLMIKLLVLNGADVDRTYVEGTTPLIVAVLNQQFEAAQILLTKGADPDHRDDYSGTALLYAAAMNDYQIADLLLYYGASDTIRDKDGNSALMTAVFFGNLETADVLLQDGLDPDAVDADRKSPLMIAARQGNRDITRLLLEYGADPDKTDDRNYTVLAEAIEAWQDSTAIILIDSGANINHQISPGRNIYDLARLEERDIIVEKLKELGAGPLVRPDFSEIDVAWGNSFGSDEHLMQVRFAWVDRKFGFYAESGFDFRPVLKKVQVEEDPSLIHQYRETMWIWSHGVGKYISFHREITGMEYGLYGTLQGFLSFPRYRGIEEGPSVRYAFAPAAGFYLKGRVVGIKAGAERYHFGTLNEKVWKMNISLFIRISTVKNSNGYKEITY